MLFPEIIHKKEWSVYGTDTVDYVKIQNDQMNLFQSIEYFKSQILFANKGVYRNCLEVGKISMENIWGNEGNVLVNSLRVLSSNVSSRKKFSKMR